MSATAAWSRGVAGADALRRGALRGLARTSAGRALMRDRARRLGALAILQVLAVTAVALAAPLWLLLLGPLLLGVPHVASDLRYFVVQPRTPWPPRALVAVGALLGLMTLQRVALAVGAPIPLPEGVSPLQSELGLGVSSVAAALWLGGWRRRRWPALLAVVIALAVAWRAPQAAFMAFGHGHNLVGPACALLLGWREAGRGRLADGALGGLSAHALVALAALTFVAAQGALLGGAFDGLLLGLGGLSAPATGLDLGDLEAQLAPGVGYPWSMRLTVSFAIAQAVHYAAWLRWLPQLWSPRRVPTPFAADVRGGVDALGAPLFVAVAVAAIGLPLVALVVSPTQARVGYLHAVAFHGWLELAALGLLVAAGGDLSGLGANDRGRRTESPRG